MWYDSGIWMNTHDWYARLMPHMQSIWMVHVLYAYEWIHMIHMQESYVVWLLHEWNSFMCKSHATYEVHMNESCPIWIWMSTYHAVCVSIHRMRGAVCVFVSVSECGAVCVDLYARVTPHTTKSCPIWTWMSATPHTKKSCPIWTWMRAYRAVLYVLYGGILRIHSYVRVIPYTNESCPTCIRMSAYRTVRIHSHQNAKRCIFMSVSNCGRGGLVDSLAKVVPHMSAYRAASEHGGVLSMHSYMYTCV